MRRSDKVARRFNVVSAVDRLVTEGSYDELSVNDICRQAGISRSTFYRLFDDKYEVIKWQIGLVLLAGVGKIGREYTWYDGQRVTLSGIALFPAFKRAVAKSVEVQRRRMAVKTYSQCLIDTLAQVKHQELTEDLRFQIEAYSKLACMTTRDEFMVGESVDIDNFARKLVSCVPTDLLELIDIPKSTRPVELLNVANFLELAKSLPDPLKQ